MKNLQEATERICELKGSLVAMDALMAALLRELPTAQRARVLGHFENNAEVARTVLVHAPVSEHTLAAFERDASRTAALLAEGDADPERLVPKGLGGV